MKTTSLFKTILALVTLLGLATPTLLRADDHPGEWDARHHYLRDNYGYWDGGHYHHFIEWHNHHGYWDTKGSTRIFINVD